MTNPITKDHRLAVARAWAGAEPIPNSFQGWIDGEPGEYPVYRDAFERLAQLVADAEGARWVKLQEPDGTLAVDEGATYLFAIQVSTNGARPHWEYFTDALVWDSETEPDWSSGEHGWDINDEMWFRPLPKPPEQP